MLSLSFSLGRLMHFEKPFNPIAILSFFLSFFRKCFSCKIFRFPVFPFEAFSFSFDRKGIFDRGLSEFLNSLVVMVEFFSSRRDFCELLYLILIIGLPKNPFKNSFPRFFFAKRIIAKIAKPGVVIYGRRSSIFPNMRSTVQ